MSGIPVVDKTSKKKKSEYYRAEDLSDATARLDATVISGCMWVVHELDDSAVILVGLTGRAGDPARTLVLTQAWKQVFGKEAEEVQPGATLAGSALAELIEKSADDISVDTEASNDSTYYYSAKVSKK